MCFSSREGKRKK